MNHVKVPEAEYKRLKKFERQFDLLLEYAQHVNDIAEARKEIKRGDVVNQKELFEKLGL